MPIYELTNDHIRPIDETTFSDAGISERGDLQRLLRDQIRIISPDTLVIAEEFGDWEDSRRRIDLLGIDKDANLVVIELKRTEHGGHMELQAIRYAAMVSAMTFEDVVEVFDKYLRQNGSNENARAVILKFLKWTTINDDDFAQDVRIVLASAEFSKELTTSVMWLNERDLSITCMRLKPYRDGEKLLLDVQQIIPLPEAEEYRVRLRKKQDKERVAKRMKRKWDEESFLTALQDNLGEDAVVVASNLLDWSRQRVSRIWWGEGAKKASFVAIQDTDDQYYNIFRLGDNGKISIWLHHLREREPFTEGRITGLLNRLNEIPGMNFPSETENGQARFDLATLSDPPTLRAFQNVCEWMINEIRGVGEKSTQAPVSE